MKNKRLTCNLNFLLSFSIFNLITFIARSLILNTFYFWFLLWNLFLAWIPYLLALKISKIYKTHKLNRSLKYFLIILLGLVWIIFFPNAPYILTDLIHVRSTNPFYLFSGFAIVILYSINGLLLGFASLKIIQKIVTKEFGARLSLLFTFCVLLLTSYGIYLGREIRLNSWDIFLNPSLVFSEVFNLLSSNIYFFKILQVVIFFFLTISSLYLISCKVIEFEE